MLVDVDEFGGGEAAFEGGDGLGDALVVEPLAALGVAGGASASDSPWPTSSMNTSSSVGSTFFMLKMRSPPVTSVCTTVPIADSSSNDTFSSTVVGVVVAFD